MKMITLDKLRDSLQHMRHEVTVPKRMAQQARLAIDRMVAIN
jgi:quinolinate synthase